MTSLAPETTVARLPTFIGIGALKAATTWLSDQLMAHPDIYLPPIQETHFFGYPYPEHPFTHYETFFQEARPGQLIGEFSSDYLDTPEVPARIKKHLPDTRLILMLRDPVDLVQSNYWHLLRQNFKCRDTSQPDLATALQRHESLLIQPARLGFHLSNWLKHFPLDQFILIWHEDIRSNSAAVVKRLYRELGVDSDFTPAIQSAARGGVSPRGGWSGRAYSWLYQIAVVRGLGPLSRRWNYATPLAIVQRLKLRQMAERVFFKKGYPPPDPQLLADLRSRFEQDINLLEKLTGRDLSKWKSTHTSV